MTSNPIYRAMERDKEQSTFPARNQIDANNKIKPNHKLDVRTIVYRRGKRLPKADVKIKRINGIEYVLDGGMSVYSDIKLIAGYLRPSHLKGGSKTCEVWELCAAALPEELEVKWDVDDCGNETGHGTIRPKKMMTLQKFRELLNKTYEDWKDK